MTKDKLSKSVDAAGIEAGVRKETQQPIVESVATKKTSNRRDDKKRSIENVSPNKSSSDLDAGSSEGQEEEKKKKVKKTFTRDSPEYFEFISMVAKNEWNEKLPSTKKSKELSDFMEKHQFTRAQLSRKFNELQRWWAAQIKKGSLDSKPEQAVGDGAKDELPEKSLVEASLNDVRPTNNGAKTGPLVSNNFKESEKRNGTKTDPPVSKNTKESENHLKDAATTEGDCDENDDWNVPEKSRAFFLPPLSAPELTPHTSRDMSAIPGPPSGGLSKQYSSSAFSPLRSKPFHDIAPRGYHVSLMDPQSAPVPIPPELTRIQTGEVDQLLKGQLMQDPDSEESSSHYSSPAAVAAAAHQAPTHHGDPYFFPRRRNSFVYHHNASTTDDFNWQDYLKTNFPTCNLDGI